MRRLTPVVLLLALLLLGLSSAVATRSSEAQPQGQLAREPVTLQFLNVSDWHGQLDPLVVGSTQVGGAAVLSAYFQQHRAANPNTLTLTAGDAYGASPPLSSFFQERPAVLAKRLMGFDVDTFGNHNFDKGTGHLQQMMDLAGAPTSASEPGEPYSYVAANLKNRDDNLSGVADWKIFDVGGVKVGVVGLVNEEAPTLVFPSSFGTIEVTNAVPAANKARAAMKRAGAQVFVAITHKGIRGFENGAPFGELIDFANNVGGFDLILGDHTDLEYSGVHGSALVSMNRSKGLRYSKTLLTVDPQNGRVIDRSVEFITPTASAVTPDPAIVAMLQPFRDAIAPILNTQIGSSTVFVPRADACGRADGRLCESLVGNTVTDSMRLTYGTDFAITNSGGLRANLTCPTTDSPTDFCPAYTPPPFPITRGQVLTVLPFGNIVVTLNDFRGDELKAWLEQGVSSMPGANGRFAQVSGLCFTYAVSAPVGSRVTGAVRQAANGTCTGPAIDLTSASTYTLATNDFMASGGDGYPNVFARATSRDIMDQVLADYVGGNSPISPAIQGRITCTTSGATACPTILP